MSHNITVEGGKSVRLPTKGKYCDRDIVITATGGAEDLNAVLTEQEALIAELQDTLRGKAAGSGGGDLNAFLENTLTTLDSNTASLAVYGCYQKSALTSVNLPNATAIGDRALYSCTNLESFNAPNVASIGTYAFYECRNLKSLRFPKLTAIPANAFYRATSLTIADFASVTSIGGQAFAQCTSLKVLALRNPDAVVTIQSNSLTSSFGQTLVPSALLSQYKSATNWSARATSIKALEDYTVDGTITGELDETKIVW